MKVKLKKKINLCQFKFSGRSTIQFHANTSVKDGKLQLEDIKINLNLGDVEVHIIKSQNPALGKNYGSY